MLSRLRHFLKKKRKETEQNSFNEYIRKKAEINYLSPAQIEEVIANNTDINFIEMEMKDKMNFPDVEYLTRRLMPEIKQDLVKKDIEPIELVRATALGDIIGSRYEFIEYDYNSMRTKVLPQHHAIFTDDTVLSYATMKAVLDCPEKPDFRQAYIDFYHKYPSAGYGSSFVNWALNGDFSCMEETNDNQHGYHSMANGCVMRLSFIPAYYDTLEEVVQHTISSVMVTHDHVESIKGAVIFAVCIWMALHNYSKEEIYDYCKQHYSYTAKEREELIYNWCQFDMNTPLKKIDNKTSQRTLMTNYAVPFVITCFYETQSYDDCMREILSHYGDNDTLCAMAGGLCMAFYETTGYKKTRNERKRNEGFKKTRNERKRNEGFNKTRNERKRNKGYDIETILRETQVTILENSL